LNSGSKKENGMKAVETNSMKEFDVRNLFHEKNPKVARWMPVNKHGTQGKLLAEQLDATFRSDVHILTFPAGLVSRKIKRQIIDRAWQKSFINKARQYQRDIIPIHIGGENSKFFYRLSNFRKFLGVKANIEMLYLINETYKHRNKHITIKFGKPIPWQTFDKSKRPIEWANWVKDLVYKMDGVENVLI